MSKYISFFSLKGNHCERSDPRSHLDDMKRRRPIDVFSIDKVEIGFLDTCIVHIGDKKKKVEMKAGELEDAIRGLTDDQVLIVRPHYDEHLTIQSYEDDYRMPLVALEEKINKRKLAHTEGKILSAKEKIERIEAAQELASKRSVASFGIALSIAALIMTHFLGIFRFPVGVLAVACIATGIAFMAFLGFFDRKVKLSDHLRGLHIYTLQELELERERYLLELSDE